MDRPALLFLLPSLFLFALSAGAQPTPPAPNILGRRTLQAVRLTGPPPVIDGLLDDSAWASAPVARDFVQSRPRPATLASLPSEARVLADEDALYVALAYDDPEPACILRPLVRRDDETTSDWAFVEIDSRHDRHSAFSFGVNPSGVQVDGLWISDSTYDSAWNGVWESAARVNPHGWAVELRIPFSQLAFALPAQAGEPLVFGINFYRFSPGHGESANWSPRYPALGGVVSHFNDITVPAPSRVPRLEISPFVATRVGREPEEEGRTGARAGADLRIGLGPSFSLTATLRPDFGQVEADPSQVNLGAFELFQAERRPFFLEGLDLFRFDTGLAFSSRGVGFGDEAPFYSRRIGRTPPGEVPAGYGVESLPAATTIDGAAKLTGQTANGWNLGGFAAWSGAEEARLRDAEGHAVRWPLEARSREWVGRAVKTSQDGRTNLGLFALDLHRSGLGSVLAPQLPSDAASAGVEARHRIGAGAYELRGWALASEVSGDPEAIRSIAESPRHLYQRPDGGRYRPEGYGRSLSGYAGEGRLVRRDGDFRFDLAARAVSPGFDVDETGFQTGSDWLLLAGDWRLDRYPRSGPIRTWAVGSENLGWGWTLDGETRARVASAFLSFEGQSTWGGKLTATEELEALSLDRLRGGPALLLPPRSGLALNLLSDQRKATFATLDATFEREPGSGSSAWSLSPFWNLRLTRRLQGSIGPGYRVDTVGWQPLARVPVGPATEELVSRLRQRTLSLTLRADWVFSPRFSLQLYAQPFVTSGHTDRVQRLRAPRDPSPERRFEPLPAGAIAAAPDGSELALDLDGDGTRDATIAKPDGQLRDLNASLIVRWEYRPGSFLTAVWNQRRSGASIDGSGPLGHALGDLADDRSVDVLLLKLSRRFGR